MFIHFRLVHPELEVGQVQQLLLAKQPATLAMEVRSYVNAMVQTVSGTCRSATLVDNSAWGIAGLAKQCPQLENLSLSDQTVRDVKATLEAMKPILGRIRNLSVAQAMSLDDLELFRQTVEKHPNLHLYVQEVLVPAADWTAYIELTDSAQWGRMHVNTVTVGAQR
jgi:hypothetical protein